MADGRSSSGAGRPETAAGRGAGERPSPAAGAEASRRDSPAWLRRLTLALLVALLGLHFAVRLLETGHAATTVSSDFFSASINFAAGKGFRPGVDYYFHSPQLKEFHHRLYGLERGTASWEEVFRVTRDFDDFDLSPVTMRDNYSIGYRLLVGIAWRLFGFSPAAVVAVNYLLSALALLALFDLARRLGGLVTALCSGLLYALAAPEIFEVASFGRDGTPLYGGVLMAWIWIRVMPGAPGGEGFTRSYWRRAVLAAALAGAGIAFASQLRSSNIYFLPLSLIFVAVHTLFALGALWARGRVVAIGRAALLGAVMAATILASHLAFISATRSLLPDGYRGPPAALMHTVFAGLGMFNNAWWPAGMKPAWLPVQTRFDDGWINSQVHEYGHRHGRSGIITYLGPEYNEVLAEYYRDIVLAYPSSVLRNFVLTFEYTGGYLGRPMPFFSLYSPKLQRLNDLADEFYAGPRVAGIALAGIVLLFFYPWRPRAALILLGFGMLNAAAAGIQFHARHVLMGHFVYWLGWGLVAGAAAALVGNLIGRLPLPAERRAGRLIRAVARALSMRSHDSPERLAATRLRVGRSAAAIAGLALGLLAASALLQWVDDRLRPIEEETVRRAIRRIEAAPVLSPPPFPLRIADSPASDAQEDAGALALTFDHPEDASRSVSLEIGTTAIVLEFGEVPPPPVPASARLRLREASGRVVYETRVALATGEEVKAAFPVFHIYPVAVEVSSDRPIRGYSWIGLQHLEGPLWEGSYDAAQLAPAG